MRKTKTKRRIEEGREFRKIKTRKDEAEDENQESVREKI